MLECPALDVAFQQPFFCLAKSRVVLAEVPNVHTSWLIRLEPRYRKGCLETIRRIHIVHLRFPRRLSVCLDSNALVQKEQRRGFYCCYL